MKFYTFFLLLGSPLFAFANAGITYHGRLLNPNGTPVTGANVQFKLQLRTPGSENCLMYEEVQSKDLSDTSGVFSLTINDGTGTRLDSSGYGLDRIFANRNSYTFAAGICASGSTYTPNASDGRKIQVLFNDGSLSQWEPIPPMSINFVPIAIEAMQIGGYQKEQLVKVADGVATTATEFSGASWTALLALINGTSTQYPTQASFNTLNTAVQTFAKTTLPTCTASQALSGNGTALSCITMGTGTLTAITAAATAGNPLTFAGTATAPTVDIPKATAAANGYLASADWTTFNDKQAAGSYITALTGHVTSSSFTAGSVTTTIANDVITNTHINSAAAIADTKLATISTAGKVSGSAITSGNIVTTGGFSSSSNIATSANFNLFDSSTATNKISIQAPASGITDYTIKLPAVIGSANQVLSIASVASGVATMEWANSSSGSVTSVAAAATAGNPIVIAGTASAPTVDIPVATTSASGYLSSTDWTAFNNKLGSSLASAKIWVGSGTAVATAVNVSGDVSMDNAGAFSVDKIKGKSVTAPTVTGQVLRYDGTNITPNFVGMTDLRSNVTGTTALAATCGADQTLTYNSAMDNLACANIAIAGSQVSGNIAGNAANVTGTVALANGGTGATTQAAAAIAVLPSQASNSGKYLTTDGTNASWGTSPSQWVTTGSDIYYTTGSVGIGNTAPGTALDITGATTIREMAAPAVSAASKSILYMDSTSHTLKLSQNTGAYSDVATTASVTASFLAKTGGTLTGTLWSAIASVTDFNSAVEHSSGYSGYITSFSGGNDTMAPFHAALFGVSGTNNYALIGAARSNSSWSATASAIANGTYLPGIAFAGQSGTALGTDMVIGAAINGVVDGAVSSGVLPSAINFRTSPTNSTGLVERMRITSAGKVGIGTTAPTTAFEVKNSTYGFSFSPASGGSNLTIGSSVGSYVINHGWTGANTLNFGPSGFSTPTVVMSSGRLGVNSYNAASAGIEIAKYGADDYLMLSTVYNTNGDVFIVKNSGNVGIGVIAPSTLLQVGGIISPSVDNTYTLGTAALRFTDVYAVSGVVNTSDARQKREIANSDLGLDFISKLRPVSYRWKTGTDETRHYGLIAQETEKLLQETVQTHPEQGQGIVDYDSKNDRYGIRYTELISPLIKAVQELYGLMKQVMSTQAKESLEVDLLKEKINKLENENQEMKLRLQRIEEKLLQ